MNETIDETAQLTADIVLIGSTNQRKHVLLIRRSHDPYKDHWALPGGHVNAGEETEDAAHRELCEETGLRAAALWRTGVYSAVGRDPRGRYVTFAYVGHREGTPDPTAGDDAAEAAWFPIDDVLSGRVPVAFDHQQIIADAVR